MSEKELENYIREKFFNFAQEVQTDAWEKFGDPQKVADTFRKVILDELGVNEQGNKKTD